MSDSTEQEWEIGKVRSSSGVQAAYVVAADHRTDEGAAALLGRLVQAIYHDTSAVEWLRKTPTDVAEALGDAQRFCGVGEIDRLHEEAARWRRLHMATAEGASRAQADLTAEIERLQAKVAAVRAIVARVEAKREEPHIKGTKADAWLSAISQDLMDALNVEPRRADVRPEPDESNRT